LRINHRGERGTVRCHNEIATSFGVLSGTPSANTMSRHRSLNISRVTGASVCFASIERAISRAW
jgi:hypothetical protein